MRLIDADKLYPDRMTNKGTLAISQSQIADAPTVQAVPIIDCIESYESKYWIEGCTEYICPHCHSEIKDEVFYLMEDRNLQINYCPCCGNRVEMKDGE